MLSIQLAMNVAAVAGSAPIVPGAPLQLAAGVNFQAKPGDAIRGLLVLETGNKGQSRSRQARDAGGSRFEEDLSSSLRSVLRCVAQRPN